MLKELNASNNNVKCQIDDQENLEENRVQKRKLTDQDSDGDENEDEDDDDEEIYSDTDEEMRANELKKAKKLKKTEDFNFSNLEENQLEDYLNKINKSFQKYR